LTENLLKENFVKVIPFTRSKFDQSFYPKLPLFKLIHKSWFRKDVNWSIPI